MEKIFICAFLLFFSASSFALPVVDNYRIPDNSDVNGEWLDYKKSNNVDAFKILSDFNSDGIEDQAWILPRTDKNGLAVVAFIKTKESMHGIDYRVFKLDEINDLAPQQFVLELALPSDQNWETACGKGYRDCGLNEPAEIKIKVPSIMFCKIESACSIYLWDQDNKVFSKISLSD